MGKKRLVIWLIMVMLAISPVFGANAIDLSEYDTIVSRVEDVGSQLNISSWVDSAASYVKVDGVLLDEDHVLSFDYNDSVDFYLVWKIPNSAKAELIKELSYQLPDNIRFNQLSGTIKDGTNVVGNWRVENSQLLINYNDEFVNGLDSLNDLVGTLHIYGKLGKTEITNPDGEDVILSFPGLKDVTVHINKTEQYLDLSISKYLSDTSTENTLNDREFVIQVTSYGQDYNNVVITDKMGNALKLNGNVTAYDSDNNPVTVNVTSTADGFIATIPQVPANSTYYLKYKASIQEDFINTGDKSDNIHYDSEKNSVTLSSSELEGEKQASMWVKLEKNKVEKAYEYDSKTQVVNYTLTVNGGLKTDIAGTILTDFMDGYQTYIDGSFYVEVDGVRTEIEGLNFETLKNGFIFPANSDKVYKIHYQASVSDDSQGKDVVNEINLFDPETGNTTESETSFHSPKKLDVSKKWIAYDEESRIITWQTDLVISEDMGALDYINVTDLFDVNKLRYVDGSFRINIDNFDYSSVSALDYGGFSVVLGSYSHEEDKKILPGIYTMTYQTEIIDDAAPGTHIYNNNISFEYDGGNVSTDATYTLEIAANVIGKIAITDANQWQWSTPYEEGYLTYVIDISKLDDSVNDFSISDTIPTGTSYIEGSAELLNKDNPSWPVVPPQVSVNIDGNNLVFEFSNTSNQDLLPQLKEHGNLLRYKLSINGDLYGEQVFENTAHATVDGVLYPDVNARAERNLGNPIEKSYLYTADSSPVVTYTIKINPNAGDLNPNSNKLDVTDTMGSGLDFIRGSLEVNGEKSNSYQYNDETHELTFNVPDETAIVVTYRCYVNLPANTEFQPDDSFNTVKIAGIKTEQKETTTTITGSVFEANGTTSGVGNAITIYKYLNGDLTRPLGGATFDIYKVNTKIVNGLLTVDETNPIKEFYRTVTTATTGDIGYARISGLGADEVYVIVEQEQEDYYKADNIYFVVSGHDNNTYDISKIKVLPSSKNNYTFNINNDEKPPEVTVEVEKKAETAEGDYLPGARMQLLKGDTVVEEWTTTDTVHKIEADLIIGEEYIIHEVEAPEGYDKAADITFTVADTEDIQLYTMVDKKTIIPIIPKVSIEKVDENGRPLSGATLQILKGTTVIEEWVTDGNPKELIILEAGMTYTLHEVSAPEGYEVAPDQTFTVEEREDVQTIIMEDIKSPTEITVKIKKQDAANNNLPGAELQLLDKNGDVVEEWVSADEPRTIVSDLVIGETYTIHEVRAPEGYEIAADITFTVEDTEDEQLFVMTDIKKPNDIKVQVHKHDEAGQYLPGAKMQLLQGTTVVEEWTTTDTVYNITSKLTIGEQYTIHELEAPTGYERAEDITFTVEDTNDIQSFTMVDKKEIIIIPVVTKIAISKVDEDKNLLPNAELEIYDKDGNKVASWTTTSEVHQLLGVLKVGEVYTLHEVKAPVGYQKAADIEISVKDTNDIQAYEMIDPKTKTSIAIEKVSQDGTKLVGAKLQILDEEGTVIEEWITDGNPHKVVADLVIGKSYIIHEEQAPEGYELAPDQTFTVKDTEEIQSFTMVDKKKPTKITVQVEKQSDNNQSLKGAKLQILDEEGTVIEEWITDGNPHRVVADLIIGKSYTIHEEQAPEGYELAPDQTFTVKDTEEIQSFTMIDTKEPNKVVVQISKYSDSNELLKGAKLQLLDSNNKVIEEWITDGNVYTVKTELVIGKTYTIHEAEAPEGYEKAEDMTFTVEDTNDVQEFKMIDVKKKETIVSPDTGDTQVLKYIFVSIVSAIAIIIGIFSIKKVNKNQASK